MEPNDSRFAITPEQEIGIERMLDENRLIREAVLANIERKKKEKWDKMMNPKTKKPK